MIMSEQEKIALLERLAASGANIGQVNLGDGHQYFGCAVTQISSTPSPQPKVVQVVDVVEASGNTQQPTFDPYPFIQNKDKAEDIIALLRKYMTGIDHSKPKDLMMPVRAAFDAGVIRKPTYGEFKQALPDLAPKNCSSFDKYLRSDSITPHPYDTIPAFIEMVKSFKALVA